MGPPGVNIFLTICLVVIINNGESSFGSSREIPILLTAYCREIYILTIIIQILVPPVRGKALDLMEVTKTLWFEEVFDELNHYVGILSPEGRVIRLNRSTAELMGVSASELENHIFWEIPSALFTKSNWESLKGAVQQASVGLAVKKEIEIRRRGQHLRAIDFSIKPVLDERADVKFLLVEGRDISKYKRTRKALDQTTARFEAVFNRAGMGILIKDINGRILDCNPAFQSMLGYSADELRDRDFLGITYPADRDVSQRLFTELIDGKRNSYTVEKRYVHKDGQPIWNNITTTLVRGPEDEVQFVIAMAENISTQKQIEVELIELQQRLMQGRELERLQIAQDMHDSVLQEIIGITFQIKDLENLISSDEGREQIQAMKSSLQELTVSVRAICRELRPPTLVPFGLERTIQSHIGEFQAAHPELDIKLQLMHDGQSLPESLRIVLFRIYQEALMNIVRHAQASRVLIVFELKDDQALLEVEDNGIGFELPERWLELARRGNLGLVGARERAKDAGGRLEIRSAPGKGTRISVSVPIEVTVSNGELVGRKS